MFTEQQKSALDKPLSSGNVKSRKQGGRDVSYIEGWRVIAEANRIFGFDGWTRETVDIRCVSERERKIGQQGKEGWGVSYIARVRVVVFAGDALVTREGVGAGHGIDTDLGQAHESAIKESETDAMKRALMTFGNPFGLALYDKQQSNVVDERDEAKSRFIEMTRSMITTAQDATELGSWWNDPAQKKQRRDFGLTPDELGPLKDAVMARIEALKKKEAA